MGDYLQKHGICLFLGVILCLKQSSKFFRHKMTPKKWEQACFDDRSIFSPHTPNPYQMEPRDWAKFTRTSTKQTQGENAKGKIDIEFPISGIHKSSGVQNFRRLLRSGESYIDLSCLLDDFKDQQWIRDDIGELQLPLTELSRRGSMSISQLTSLKCSPAPSMESFMSGMQSLNVNGRSLSNRKSKQCYAMCMSISRFARQNKNNNSDPIQPKMNLLGDSSRI